MDTVFHFGRFNVRINGKLVQLRDNSIDFFMFHTLMQLIPKR